MSTSIPSGTRPLGTHTLRIEDDVVFLVQDGDYTLDDAIKTHAEIEGVLAAKGRVFIAVDQARSGTTSPEVRRFIANWNKRHRATGAVIYGGSTMSRAAASLVLSAIRLFQPNMPPIVFTRTAEEARAWISAQRARLFSESQPSA
ncbi:MAG: hypothetical protein JNJ46_19205 [Myxococcales bacterium]|nr:hypothetical protein [Myxococcales bacterium]